MLQVNLVGKKRKEKSSKNWIVILFLVLFVSLVVYFLGVTIYVVLTLSSIGKEIKKVDNEAVEISSRISANKESLSRYVLSKHILDKVGALKKERFRYKDYLDQVVKYLPVNVSLKNVDFSTKGWVTVSVFLPRVSLLKEIERNLKDPGLLDQSEFVSVFSESVSSDNLGSYNMKLYFELKPNAGK